MQNVEKLILAAFEKNNIEINYEGDGLFVFSSFDEMKRAEEIIYNIVGYEYNIDNSDMTIWVFLNDEDSSIEEQFELLKELFNKNQILEEDYKEILLELKGELEETYSEEELNDFIDKVFNQQKVQSIYRRHRYNDSRLYAHTRCTECGREKRVFLSNLINDPDKYGSCVCSKKNIESRLDNINSLYDGSKKLSSNTSGYTGVTFVRVYNGKPYNKWRAYIEVDGKRTYLGDFDSKQKAIRARKAAANKGIKWYQLNKNQFMKDIRKRTKRRRSNSRS